VHGSPRAVSLPRRALCCRLLPKVLHVPLRRRVGSLVPPLQAAGSSSPPASMHKCSMRPARCVGSARADKGRLFW
jgi:hypothetical protein